MAFTGRTPESLIPRSDSRNPATTCKGVTKAGRHCRRAIDAKPSPGDNGVLAVVSVVGDSDEEETGAAAFYCWQHKDQAPATGGPHGQETQLYPLRERSSVDTLVARLGVLEVNEPAQTSSQTTEPTGPKVGHSTAEEGQQASYVGQRRGAAHVCAERSDGGKASSQPATCS
jgi:hypothetical protein